MTLFEAAPRTPVRRSEFGAWGSSRSQATRVPIPLSACGTTSNWRTLLVCKKGLGAFLSEDVF